MIDPDKEVSLLEILKHNPGSAQRDMAEAIGLSLGMTNFLLKELSSKGWMMMRKLNARKVQYVLTPEGLAELSRRSYRYLKKSIRKVADTRAGLEAFVLETKGAGVPGLYLIGGSELSFVLDWLCRNHQLPFAEGEAEDAPPRWQVVYGEDRPARRPNLLEYVEATL